MLLADSGVNRRTHGQQSLNVLLQEGGDVLPLQDFSEPAVSSLGHHLLTAGPSRVGHVLENAWNIMCI